MTAKQSDIALRLVLPVLLVATAVSLAIAQEPIEDDRTEASDKSAQTPTAEDLLKELRKNRVGREVIPPASGSWSGARHDKQKLWPEGWAVVDRTGFLKRDGDWWTFTMDSGDETEPIRLLPNATLDVLVRTAMHAANPLRFVVSGQTTVYEGRNYLLLYGVMRDRSAEPMPQVTDDRSAAGPVAPNADVDDVLIVLQGQSAESNLLDTRQSVGARQTGSRSKSLLPDGSSVISRPARIVRQGGRYDIVFESDHPESPEPPLTMLPNLNMERMLDAVTGDNHGHVFRVSGDVTQFQGRNYILVRSAPRRLHTANFRK